MNRALSAGPSYWDVLALVIAKGLPCVQYDYWMGTLFVPLRNGGDLWVTPMFEGDALPWAVHDDDDDSRNVHGCIDPGWTGRLREDVELYRAHLADLLDRFGGAA